MPGSSPSRPSRPAVALRVRLLACLGAAVGIAGTGVICATLPAGALPVLVAPMGASAVLLFAVPASPLAQPWPVLGGNVVSALVGVAVAAMLGHGPVAAGVAVAAAILVMSILRCLHPPGGATALIAVIGGPAVAAAGWHFALVPVTANTAALLALGWGWHRLTGHGYPHRPAPPPAAPRFLLEDIDAAIAEADDAFDITRDDLARLLAAAAAAADRRLEGR